MEFIEIWKVLYQHGSTEWKMEECKQLWNTYTQQQQQQIYNTITEKLKNGKFVHYNPVRAIRENVKPVCALEMAFDDYYKKYGTTEEVEGWRRVYKPEERRTIYVKANG